LTVLPLSTAPFDSSAPLNYFLPFNPILDALCQIIYFRNSQTFLYIFFPSTAIFIRNTWLCGKRWGEERNVTGKW